MANTRTEQYLYFNLMVSKLLAYGVERNIPFRLGPAHRTQDEANALAKAGKGIKNSKHIYSLAIDLWITDGVKILWESPHYKTLGEYWVEMGGVHGSSFKQYKDIYHFELAEKPALK